VISFVGAFRSDDPDRIRVWEFLQECYAKQFPNAEVVVEADDGEDPFHKTLALNRAVARSNGETLVMIDCDTWVPRTNVLHAVAELQTTGTWGRPWNIKVKLGQIDTDQVLQYPNWDGQVHGMDHPRRREGLNTYWAAPPQVFSREQYETVGGFDERFRRWGKEDEAFGLALRCLVGRPKHVIGYAVHLWHPRLGRSGSDLWPGQADSNKGLVHAYQQAARYPDQMRRIISRQEISHG
jgi:hypothetical protein